MEERECRLRKEGWREKLVELEHVRVTAGREYLGKAEMESVLQYKCERWETDAHGKRHFKTVNHHASLLASTRCYSVEKGE